VPEVPLLEIVLMKSPGPPSGVGGGGRGGGRAVYDFVILLKRGWASLLRDHTNATETNLAVRQPHTIVCHSTPPETLHRGSENLSLLFAE